MNGALGYAEVDEMPRAEREVLLEMLTPPAPVAAPDDDDALEV